MTLGDPPPGRASAALTRTERECLRRAVVPASGLRAAATMRDLAPLLDPARCALTSHGYGSRAVRDDVLRSVIYGAVHLGTVPQGWTSENWIEVMRLFGEERKLALAVVAIRGYGAPLKPDGGVLHHGLHHLTLARRLYGRAAVDAECQRVRETLLHIGYRLGVHAKLVDQCIAELLLRHDSPSLDVVTDESLAGCSLCAGSRKALHRVSIGLVQLGMLRRRADRDRPSLAPGRAGRLGVAEEWLRWCERWKGASLKSEPSKTTNFAHLMTAGRWLARRQPAITSPADWTLDLAVEYVRYIEQLCIGDDVVRRRRLPRAGAPMAPRSKSMLMTAVRVFFHDLQEWGWIPNRFNPGRGFAVPRQITRALHAKPRPIDDGYWLKLRAAALTLRPEDLPNAERPERYQYPFEMIRAVAAAWAFSGCRANEIERLEVGCTYVENVPEQIDPASGQVVPAFKQHMLRVPVNKTRGEFVKPVEEPLALAVAAWEHVRPVQAKLFDRTAGRLTDHLFCYRGQPIGRSFLNDAIIPILLRKAGLPQHDTRGAITSHRGRATLATKLYNNASGLTSLEVMNWLGHTKLSSGQHYVELTPTRLMTAFHRSAKLTENLRCVDVLVDSRPGPGEPILRYDLGHGWCTNAAYAACAHRMACARCVFYEPAEDFFEALVRQSDRYIRMLQELRLTEDERAATTGDAEAVKQLLAHLADKPVPGPTNKDTGAGPFLGSAEAVSPSRPAPPPGTARSDGRGGP